MHARADMIAKIARQRRLNTRWSEGKERARALGRAWARLGELAYGGGSIQLMQYRACERM